MTRALLTGSLLISLALAHTLQAQPSSPSFSTGSKEEKIHFQSQDGLRLHARYFPASETKAYLLVVHGLQSHAGWFFSGESFAHAGISSFAFDRRGSGLSEGKRGYAKNAEDFLEDLEAAYYELQKRNTNKAPVHVLANSLGALPVLHYFAKNPEGIASIILSTPGTHSTKKGDYSLADKIKILTSSSTRMFKTPLEDSDFVKEGTWLDWIKNDPHSQRDFSASFLRAAFRMRTGLPALFDELQIPLYLMLASEDAVIDNDAVMKKLYEPYQGPKKVSQYKSQHYLFFGEEASRVHQDLIEWILSERLPRN